VLLTRIFKASGRAGHRFPLDTSIAIVGAGVSGVTAAYALIKKGYRRITLFEAEQRVGGKVESVEVDGEWVELGALWVVQAADTIFRMAEDLGVLALKPFWHQLWVVERPDRPARIRVESYWGARSALEVTSGLWAFNWLIRRRAFRNVFQPGFHDLHPDLTSLTMAEFAKKHGFAAILDPFEIALYASGYNAMAYVPAPYFLKLMPRLERSRLLRRCSLSPGAWMFKGGYQKFWEGAVKRLTEQGLSPRLSAKVTAVNRGGPGQSQIVVTADGNTEVFDMLIVATAPNKTLDYLDATEEERDLFGRVRYFNYGSVVFRARGLNEHDWIALRYNMTPRRNGHLFAFCGLRSRLFFGSYSSDGRMPTGELDRKLAEDIAVVGGSLDAVVQRREWSYFPHVGVDDLSTGYYERLNSLQGQRGTYFLGGLFSFETTEYCAQFAEYLVDRHC